MNNLSEEKFCLSVVSDICEKNKKTNRDNILEYEKKAKKLPQIDVPVTHHIHGGMYGREITIPAGSIITGQIYKFDHFDIMLSGDITVSTDSGEVKRLTGMNIFKGMSGKKRAGYAHKDTRWVTFHPFDGVDGDEIQEFITAETFEELEDFYIKLNRNDYLNFVDSIVMTQEEITEQVNNNLDMIDFPLGFDFMYISESKINGSGLYSKNKHSIGDLICMARINGNRTPAGRYSNHAVSPNASIILNDNGDAELVAIREIEEDEEITVNYRQVLQNRQLKGDLSCQE